MKQLLSIIFILTLSLSGFSQKIKTQKPKKTLKKIEQETIKGAPDDQDVYYVQPLNQVEIDTIHIPAGKPSLIIFDASQYGSNQSYCFNEEKEIIQNFGKDAIRIVKINKLSYIIFENKQTLDVSGAGNTYQGFAYWSGNLKDNVQSMDTAYYATEFLAKQMGVEKESSYVLNTSKYKKEIASLIKADYITEKSKEVMTAFLFDLVIPMPYSEEKDSPLYKKCFENLKRVESLRSIEVYSTDKNGKKIFLNNIIFNKNQQPILSKNFDSDGNEMLGTNFIYKNGMLMEIISGNKSILVNYDDNKMILSENPSSVNETFVFWLENNFLLKKHYLLMADDTFQYFNLFGEYKIEDNCITMYINNSVRTINCSNNKVSFPFVNSWTTYQDDEIMQIGKTKLIRKGERIFEKYNSTAKKDDFKLWRIFHLNDQNLLSSYEQIEDNAKSKVIIEYTYFPKN
jgi:hypothetical protein